MMKEGEPTLVTNRDAGAKQQVKRASWFVVSRVPEPPTSESTPSPIELHQRLSSAVSETAGRDTIRPNNCPWELRL